MKNKKTMIVIITLILLLSVVAVTYAYFASTISNNDPQRVSVQTGNLELTFNNGNGNVEGVLSVDGDPITKTFSITNNGTYDEYARISWLDLTNTYTPGSLVYTLYKSIDNNVFAQIDTGDVPATTAKATLIDQQLIEADADASSATYKNKTVYYKLEIRLVDLGESVNQTADVNASFMSRFILDVGSEPVTAIPDGIHCFAEDSDTVITCPATLPVGQRIAVVKSGQPTQVFRYIRTTDTSDTTTQLNECADGAESIACTDSDSRHPLANGQLRLLAEYNLNVGTNLVPTAAVGLQHENARGWVEAATYPYAYNSGTFYGAIAFGPSLLYNASNIKTEIETYANTLNTTYFNNESVVTGSAITRAELMNIFSCPEYDNCANTYPWIYSTSYWSSSASSDNGVWTVYSNAYFFDDFSNVNDYFGVRPVISISESLI